MQARRTTSVSPLLTQTQARSKQDLCSSFFLKHLMFKQIVLTLVQYVSVPPFFPPKIPRPLDLIVSLLAKKSFTNFFILNGFN